MAPRTYALGRRAETKAATRRRILSAAVEVYRERGVAATSIGAIAAKADVSRGSVANHFGNSEGVLEAVLDDVIESIDMPDERVLDGATSEAERIHAYVDAVVRFFDRSNSWWEVFSRDMELPILKAKEEAYWASFDRMRRAAIGDRAADDRIVAATISALLHPSGLWAFRDSGLDLDESIEAINGLVLDLVARTGRDRPMTGRAAEGQVGEREERS